VVALSHERGRRLALAEAWEDAILAISATTAWCSAATSAASRATTRLLRVAET
jgi:hypothetical protein